MYLSAAKPNPGTDMAQSVASRPHTSRVQSTVMLLGFNIRLAYHLLELLSWFAFMGTSNVSKAWKEGIAVDKLCDI